MSPLKADFLQIFEKSLFSVNWDAVDRLSQSGHNSGIEKEKNDDCRGCDFVTPLLHMITRRIHIPEEERNGENCKRKQSERH